MNYENIRALVSPVGGQLVLRDTDFPESGVAQLLRSFFDGAALELRDAVATADDEAEQVVLEGALVNAFWGIGALAGQPPRSAPTARWSRSEARRRR